jgi:hypothetical protein
MPQAAASMQYHGHWKSSALRRAPKHSWNLTRKSETNRLAIRGPLDHHLFAGGQNCGRVMQKTRREAGWGHRGWLTPAAGATRRHARLHGAMVQTAAPSGLALSTRGTICPVFRCHRLAQACRCQAFPGRKRRAAQRYARAAHRGNGLTQSPLTNAGRMSLGDDVGGPQRCHRRAVRIRQ